MSGDKDLKPITKLVSDFSRVLLWPRDQSYESGLNELQRKLETEGAYDFWQHFELNTELLDFYKTLKGQVDLCLFTSEYIQEHPAVAPILKETFTDIFSAARLNLKKSESGTYTIIANKIGVLPHEILYIDDKQSNVDAAAAAGMITLRFDSNEKIKTAIREKLGLN